MPGFIAPLRSAQSVFCVFVFDRAILERLPSPQDRRVEFIHESVRELAEALRAKGDELVVLHAHAREAIPITAAGNGPRPPGAMRSPVSASSTRWRSRPSSTPADASSGATCRLARMRDKFIHAQQRVKALALYGRRG
jgi:deoxyribodipyrimidine photolyase